VGMEEVREQEKKVNRLVLLILARGPVRYRSRSVPERDLVPEDTPDRLRLEADASAFSDDAGSVSSLTGDV